MAARIWPVEKPMGLGKMFKSLFGGGGAADGAEEAEVADSLEYNGLKIEAAPMKEGNQYRTAGYISGEHEGETRRVKFIRADNNSDRQAAIDHSISKGKQIIDEQGASLLQRSHL